MVLTKLRIRFLLLLAVVPTVILPAEVQVPVARAQVPAAEPKFNPLKALSVRSMVVGGSTITAGAVALGLRIWRNKLKKDLIEARGLVEFSPQNSLEKFLAEHQVASIEQDIVNLKKYSQWLLAAAGVLGVGAIGSVSFDMGKALAERVVPGQSGRQGPPPPPQIIERRVEVPGPVRWRESTEEQIDRRAMALGLVPREFAGRQGVTEHDGLAQELQAVAQDIDGALQSELFALRDGMSSFEKAVRNYEYALRLQEVANSAQMYAVAQALAVRARAVLESNLEIALDGPLQEQQIRRDVHRYIAARRKLNIERNNVLGEGRYPIEQAALIDAIKQELPQTAGGNGVPIHQLIDQAGPSPEVQAFEATVRGIEDNQIVANPAQARLQLRTAWSAVPDEQRQAIQALFDDVDQKIKAYATVAEVQENLEELFGQAQVVQAFFGNNDPGSGVTKEEKYAFFSLWQKVYPIYKKLPEDPKVVALVGELFEKYKQLIDQFVDNWLGEAESRPYDYVRAGQEMDNVVQKIDDVRFPRAREIRSYWRQKRGSEKREGGRSLYEVAESYKQPTHDIKRLEQKDVRDKAHAVEQLKDLALLEQQIVRHHERDDLQKRVYRKLRSLVFGLNAGSFKDDPGSQALVALRDAILAQHHGQDVAERVAAIRKEWTDYISETPAGEMRKDAVLVALNHWFPGAAEDGAETE